MVAESKLEEGPGYCKLTTRLLVDGVCDETQDAWTGFIVHLMRLLHNPDFNPVRVALMRSKPAGGGLPFEQFFKSPVVFDCEEINIYIDESDIDVPLLGASKEIAQHNDKIVLDYLAKMDRDDVVSQVRSSIIELLASGTINKQLIADRLHLSPRTLQLRLSQKDTSFQELLDDTRMTLACNYIEQRSLSVTEITYLLGFSDSSNFTRAFKRWTGSSPSDYRSKVLS